LLSESRSRMATLPVLPTIRISASHCLNGVYPGLSASILPRSRLKSTGFVS